jgi:hypothetical protein
MERPCADSEEKHEPVSDIDTAVVDGLKALDPKRPIREADIVIRTVGISDRPWAGKIPAGHPGNRAARR